ncbi:MAG: acylphosphatase [Chloroflexi bacterium]|nr:acylphosphatase [Chloroflexota bacterium]
MDDSQESNQQIEATVYGLVQGVGFRATTLDQARALGITGWVRNLPDSTVRVLAQGSAKDLESLIAFLHQGPVGARVDRVAVEWTSIDQKYDTFTIGYRP